MPDVSSSSPAPPPSVRGHPSTSKSSIKAVVINNDRSSSANHNYVLNKLGLFLIFLCIYSVSINHVLLLDESGGDGNDNDTTTNTISTAQGREATPIISKVDTSHVSSIDNHHNGIHDENAKEDHHRKTPQPSAPPVASKQQMSIYTCTYGNKTVTVPTHTPTFIMIGVQKSGTTALLTYFRDHPQILETKKKFTREAHFFDTSWNPLIKKAKTMGLKQAKEKNCYILETYMGLFHTETVLQQRANANEPPLFTFEKTPSYFANPMIARRMQLIVPWSKIILILRNPIDRLYSQYKMTIKDVFDLRNYSLEDMVQHELYAMKYQYHMTTAPLLLGEEETLPEYRDDNTTKGVVVVEEKEQSTPPIVPYDHPIVPDKWTPPHKSLGKYSDQGPLGHQILVRRGLYAIQLQWWLEQFTLHDNLLVIDYADMKRNTQEVYERILRFSGIPVVNPSSDMAKVRADDRKDHRPLSNSTRRYLQQFYAPYNAELETLLGPDWNVDKLGW